MSGPTPKVLTILITPTPFHGIKHCRDSNHAVAHIVNTRIGRSVKNLAQLDLSSGGRS